PNTTQPFTGDLNWPPWTTWLNKVEKVIEGILPNATGEVKFLVLKQFLDPAIMEHLEASQINTWEDFTKTMVDLYPLQLWQEHYGRKLTNRTLFDGLNIDEVIPMATRAVTYLELNDYWVTLAIKALLRSFQANLAMSPA
ncbi:hypothetical protein IWQ61_009984, partial [Dispira simplex]